MKVYVLKLTVLFLSVVNLISCSNPVVRNVLDDVETYIMERPDSALVVLDSIDRTLLTSDRLKAHHALLHAMALDKNYIDVDDDSLASIAVKYFSRKGPEKYEARSLYYLGLSYFYAKDYGKAVIELTKAEKVSEKADSMYLGFVKMLQANIYAATHNDDEALKYYREASGIYSKLSLPYYRNVAQWNLAKTLYNVGSVAEADSILASIIALQDVDVRIKAYATADRAFFNTSQVFSDFHNAVSLYESVVRDYSNTYMTNKDYWAYAYSLSKVGRKEEAKSLVSELSQRDTSLTSYYWRYMIERAEDNHDEALIMLEKAVTKNDIEINKVLKQSLAVLQRDYFKSQNRESELKISLRNQIIIIIVSLSILIVFVIIHFGWRYLNIQKAEKNKLMESIAEFQRQLDKAQHEDYPLLKKRFISLYKSRFEAIGVLCEQYLQNKDRDDVEKVMYNKMLLMIEDIRNDNIRRAKFEAMLNDELDDIMIKFRNEIPKCKEWEATMFCYLVAGFDATMISRLMNMPLNNVYAYKRRLRIKIESQNPENASQFLEMIS